MSQLSDDSNRMVEMDQEGEKLERVDKDTDRMLEMNTEIVNKESDRFWVVETLKQGKKH